MERLREAFETMSSSPIMNFLGKSYSRAGLKCKMDYQTEFFARLVNMERLRKLFSDHFLITDHESTGLGLQMVNWPIVPYCGYKTPLSQPLPRPVNLKHISLESSRRGLSNDVTIGLTACDRDMLQRSPFYY